MAGIGEELLIKAATKLGMTGLQKKKSVGSYLAISKRIYKEERKMDFPDLNSIKDKHYIERMI